MLVNNPTLKDIQNELKLKIDNVPNDGTRYVRKYDGWYEESGGGSGSGIGLGDTITYDDENAAAVITSGVSTVDELYNIDANPFSQAISYSSGDYVIHDGKFYVFTTTHEVGAWDNSQVSNVSIGNELKGIKNNYLPLSSGTLTNELFIEKSGDHGYYVRQPNIVLGTTTHSFTGWLGGTSIKDSNNTSMAYFASHIDTNGNTYTRLLSRNKVEGSSSDNYLQLNTDIDGTKSITLSEPAAWRNALGASDGVWPASLGGTSCTTLNLSANALINSLTAATANSALTDYIITQYAGESETSKNTYYRRTIAHALGGDTGWKTITNDNIFSGTIYYRAIGPWVNVFCTSLNLKSDLTSSGIALSASGLSSYAPYATIDCSADTSAISAPGVININTNGRIYFYKPSSVATWTTSYNINFSIMYFKA